jgi:hypothetical protein
LARIGAVVPDLLLASKVAETLGSAGHAVMPASAPDDPALAGVDLLVVDVGAVDPGAVAGRGVPVLGFYRHTEPAVRERAESAGVELVVPRSRLAREMPELVERLLGED